MKNLSRAAASQKLRSDYGDFTAHLGVCGLWQPE